MADKDFNAEDFVKLNLKNLVFRVEDEAAGDFISLDEDKCDGCGACALVCSASLWAVPEGGKARLSPRYQELCLECAACYAMCERDAIKFRYPNGGSGIIIKHG
jgi:ferredoxin-like protein FixX